MTINKTLVWKKLEHRAKKMQKTEMKNLFAKDKLRATRYSILFNQLLFDFSKNVVDDKSMKYLLALAHKVKLQDKINDMFEGKKINKTEHRAVLHVALRNRSNTPMYVDDKNVMPEINAVLAKMRKFSEAVRLGKFKGATGKKLTNIVNIGIGGSDLGPCMV